MKYGSETSCCDNCCFDGVGERARRGRNLHQIAFRSGGGIKADRAKTKLSRDRETEDLRVRISVLEKQDEFMSARLDKGDERFDKLEDKISETNGLLREILGEFKYISGTKKRAHVPEDRPL